MTDCKVDPYALKRTKFVKEQRGVETRPTWTFRDLSQLSKSKRTATSREGRKAEAIYRRTGIWSG